MEDCKNYQLGRILQSHEVVHHGLTSEVERAISGNIVREYVKYEHDNPEETEDNGIRRGHTPST